MGSLTLRPAPLLFGNSRPRITTTPLPHTTGAHGQLPRRDFNPLDLLLLLQTDARNVRTSIRPCPLSTVWCGGGKSGVFEQSDNFKEIFLILFDNKEIVCVFFSTM